MSAPRIRCGTCRHYTRKKPEREYKNGTQYYGWCKRFEHIVHANESAPARRKCHAENLSKALEPLDWDKGDEGPLR